MSDLTTLISSIISSSAVTFGLQKLFEHKLANKQYQFSKNFDRYSEVYADVYTRVIDIQIAAEEYTRVDSGDMQSEQTALYSKYASLANDFDTYFRRHAIYFPKWLEDKIREVLKKHEEALKSYRRFK